MRTTLDLPDDLMRHLKVRAAMEGRSLRDLTLELIERGLSAPAVKEASAKPSSELPTLQFGANLPAKYLSNAGLYELLAEDDFE